jgi:hypothetical protein
MSSVQLRNHIVRCRETTGVTYHVQEYLIIGGHGSALVDYRDSYAIKTSQGERTIVWLVRLKL